MPVREPVASGTPVSASRAVALPDFQNVALLCDPHTPTSIAAQIIRVLSDGELREHLAQSGRSYARPFTWRRTAEMTLDVYRSLA
jgi:glycosyltransferase involved in cell wall biosynthesis